jgi:hypothetical protein
MIKGSGAGSIPLTNNPDSYSRGPKSYGSHESGFATLVALYGYGTCFVCLSNMKLIIKARSGCGSAFFYTDPAKRCDIVYDFVFI